MENTQSTLRAVNLDHFRAINAGNEADDLSGRYSFIPTTQVVDVFRSSGWLPVRAQENRVMKVERAGYQKHVIRFRQDGALPTLADPIFPEIVLTNSHDGLAAFSIFFGLFRLICSNGAVVSDSTFAAHKIRHIGYTAEKVRAAIGHVMETIPRIVGTVDQYRQIELRPEEREVFAEAALTVKHGDQDERGERTFDVKALLIPWRREDQRPDLWTTFNIIQEKLIKGGRYETKPETGWRARYHETKAVKARAVNSISENIRINRGLWLLTEKMAELKGLTALIPAAPVLEGVLVN